jgi:hypothetical protein
MVKCPICQEGEVVTERIKEVAEISSMGHEAQDSPNVVEVQFYERQENIDILDEKVYCTNCKTEFEHDVVMDGDYYLKANLEKVVLK